MIRRTFSKIKLFKEHEERFFSEVVKVDRTYKYYEGDYLYNDVEDAAKKYGIVINYNTSGSYEYIRYGSYNFTVVSKSEPDKKQPELQYFDINELAI